jgi:uncharacterized protein (DUF433 family)
MDWSKCALVETIPGKVGGRPVVKGSRVPADTVAESAELGETPEEIAYSYDLDLEDVRDVLAYAAGNALVPPS